MVPLEKSKTWHCFFWRNHRIWRPNFLSIWQLTKSREWGRGRPQGQDSARCSQSRRRSPWQILLKIGLRKIKTDQQHQTKSGVSNFDIPEVILNIVRKVNPDPRVHGLWDWRMSTKSNIFFVLARSQVNLLRYLTLESFIPTSTLSTE